MNAIDIINKARDIRDGRYGARFLLSELHDWLHHDLEQLAVIIEEINAQRDAEQEYRTEMDKAAEETGKEVA